MQGISFHSNGENSLSTGIASKPMAGNEKDELRGKIASDAGFPSMGRQLINSASDPFRDSVKLALSPPIVRHPLIGHWTRCHEPSVQVYSWH